MPSKKKLATLTNRAELAASNHRCELRREVFGVADILAGERVPPEPVLKDVGAIDGKSWRQP